MTRTCWLRSPTTSQPIRDEALKSGLLNPKVLGVNIKTLQYQVPGGMLSNLVSQLKEAGQEDKYRAVLEEIPRVRKDFGEPPLVTPSSQIVGTQAVMNVIMAGERYKMVPKESKKIMMGEFGQTVKPFNTEVQKKIIGDATPITCRPADLIPPQLPQFEKECAQWKQQDEDVSSLMPCSRPWPRTSSSTVKPSRPAWIRKGQIRKTRYIPSSP